MFKTTRETAAFFDTFLDTVDSIPAEIGIVVCPPFTSLQTAREKLRKKRRPALGAQNMHWEPSGPFTGEIAAPMLLDLGVEYVILGHSERRRCFGETDEDVRLKTAAALAHGLIPIVAVGEPLEIRLRGEAVQHVLAQTAAALRGVDAARVVMAYEPIWAIGTGRNCEPSDANDVMHAMRESVAGLRDAPLLYGGSVNKDNISSYASQAEIDGALVGGASLDASRFAQLCRNAAA